MEPSPYKAGNLEFSSPIKSEYFDTDRKIAELKAKEEALDKEIDELEREIEAAKLGLNIKTGHINVDSLIDAELGPTEKNEKVSQGVVKELNDKAPKVQTSPTPRPEKATRRIKRVLLNLLVVASCAITSSFTLPKSASSLTYENVKINDLKDWERIKLGQDEINKLDNLSIILEANKHSGEKYFIVDKSAGMAHLYQGPDLITSYEVGVGQNIGDDQTVTVVRDGKVYWDLGNKKTGAGIYTVNKRGTFLGSPSFTMLNERGIEVPTAFHRSSIERRKFFNNNNAGDNRMSNGCFNFQPKSLDDLARQRGFGKGTKVFVLPDNPHNKFQLVDGELRFLSNEQHVNKTIRPYEPKPIVLIAEEGNYQVNEFLEAVALNKSKLMRLYPTVSNDIYNQLAKIAYGICGQESRFGTYGGARGQSGMVKDYVGIKFGKNVSAGITQMRLTSINQKVKDQFEIRKTEDLLDNKKAAAATMSLLLDIYTTNIPNDKKDEYEKLVPFYYNNPFGTAEAMEANKAIDSAYVRKVLEYSEKVKVYSLAFP